MRRLGTTVVIATALIALASSSLVGGLTAGGAHLVAPVATANSVVSVSPTPAGTSAPSSPLHALPPTSAVSRAFDQRVRTTARALAAAGVPADEIRLPYAGASAQVENGAVVPGYAVAAQNVSSYYEAAPAPSGIAYYGESDPSGHVAATSLNASSVAGSLTVNSASTLYMDVDTPDMWGIQLNVVLGDVTLHHVPGNEFWVQNTADVFEDNNTINLGEDTWNFSSPGASIANDTSTILTHNPNGSVIGGLYIGEGPWLYAPQPFTLALYVNSSLTPADDQELWYNYSLSAAGGIHHHGTYDSLVFNTGGSGHTYGIAPFTANGFHLDPVGATNDFEFDFPIGGYNGASQDVLAANMTATLDYCPITIASCTPAQLQSVPAATNFGGETGETSLGLSVTYTGTTAIATAGPFILRGLWGFAGAAGSAAGSIPITNRISVSGSPVPSASAPYVFVFLYTPSLYDSVWAWAPDVPLWHLAPGTYSYGVMLSDYANQTGTLVVGATPTSLKVDLPYHPSSGVYTPLWALSNAQLAGISTSGDGTLASQYVLFNNPTENCTACDGAPNGNLTGFFLSANDYVFPSFTGVLLDGTTAYVDVNAPVSFTVFYFTWGGGALPTYTVSMELQIVFYQTEDVTLSDATAIGGWPAFYETETLAGVVNASQNFFPQASVVLWGSSHDLVMANEFTSTATVPTPSQSCGKVCSEVYCYGCVAPDELLLYGGSENTVWGNTFRDPAQTQSATYAGLAEAESGDLIYNNNFSVDNPTVYLPYDIYTDACPAGYAGDCGPVGPPSYDDAWNVVPLVASTVEETINGFALSGSVLGPACGSQGGNYWGTYGDALNPTSTLPFVNVYDYSEDTALFPAHVSTTQASIRVGGDQYPLMRSACTPGTHYPVHIHEVGLPSGTGWYVRFSGGYLLSSTSSTMTTSALPGEIYYLIGAPTGYGLVRVTGHGVSGNGGADITRRTTLIVHFGVLEELTFTEVTSLRWPGLPSGSKWSVELLGTAYIDHLTPGDTTNATSVSFLVPKGAVYSFLVEGISGYRSSPVHGHVTVPKHAVVKDVKFRVDT